MVRITHYRKKCIGCNYCVEVAPETWDIDQKNGKSILLDAKYKKDIATIVLSDDFFEANKEAADICPVNVIKVEMF